MLKRPSLSLSLLLRPIHPLPLPLTRSSSTATLTLDDSHNPSSSSLTHPGPPPSLLPPSLRSHIPLLPALPPRVIKTDPRCLPDPGKLFHGDYDHLSSINPRTTLRPIWDVGPKENMEWFKEEGGKVPPLWGIEHSWEKMDGGRRERLMGHLKDRQKGDWRDLSLVEKKAIWYIGFGEWGTRAPRFEHGTVVPMFFQVFLVCAGGTFVFYTAKFARERGMKPDLINSTDYKRKVNARLRADNVNPITGLSSSGYGGRGMIDGTGILGTPGKTY